MANSLVKVIFVCFICFFNTLVGFDGVSFAAQALEITPQQYFLQLGEQKQEPIISPAPDEAKIYIISPSDGATVPETFDVKFGLSGMGIAPAGIDRAQTGHHHLLVDLTELPDLTQSLPATEQIRHFGGGQTETTLTLPPGKHSLRLLLGNYVHVPHQPPILSEPITVYVR